MFLYFYLTNLFTPFIQIKGLHCDKTPFSTIPTEKKVTEGCPQNTFSKLFYRYEMSSLHGRSRKLTQFLSWLSWFLAKTYLYCSVRASYSSVLLQHPRDGKLSLGSVCFFTPRLYGCSFCLETSQKISDCPTEKAAFPHIHTQRPVSLTHWPSLAAVFPPQQLYAVHFFVLLGPTRHNGWPEEQRLDSSDWGCTAPQGRRALAASGGDETVSLHQQTSTPTQCKLFPLYAALVSGRCSSLQPTASYSLRLAVLPL